MRRKLIVSAILVLFSFSAYPHKLTVVYTGNTYSALYPCRSCPASVGGGVARRSSAIQKIRDAQENVILIDSGNFTAGGSFDQESINPEIDGARTLFCYQAMEHMKYDAVGLGDAEFNFGVEFLQANIQKHLFKFIAANVNLKGVLPYSIKDFAKFKVGLIGLSPARIAKKAGLRVEEYRSSLEKTLKALKGKVDLIFLVSSLSDEENAALGKDFPEVKLIFSSALPLEASPKEIDDVVIFKPSLGGKDIRIVDVEFRDVKTLKWKFRREPLPVENEEDLQIKRMIPSCFREGDCPQREGLVATCQDPGKTSSLCTYYEAKKIDALIITDTNCPFCSIEFPQQVLKSRFGGLNFKILDYKDRKAKTLVKKYKIDTLPAFLLPKEISAERAFADISQFVDERKDKLVLKKELAGLFLFLTRKERPDTIDFFFDFYDPNARDVLKDLADFSKENRLTINVHFVTPKRRHLDYSGNEMRVALAIKKLYPDKFLSYIFSRLENINTFYWMEPIEELGMNFEKVKKLATSAGIERLVKKNQTLVDELKIGEGNIVLIKNNRIFKAFQLEPEELKKFFTP
ncbi:MAG: hypothetical protein JSW40_06765 [Candidatus Omnitrophota bacterium]|nr:MAG: hypothetical protein JSW40_06765 [Candidatus Omnitrophota bacterium]